MLSRDELNRKIADVIDKVFKECPELQRTQFTEALVRSGVIYGMVALSEVDTTTLTSIGDNNEPR